ncbi:MAG: hypothetical protein LIP03_03290 [Bacteroidales bacterium]|nr:hypothetical protein [Bacteroidales bacterium]
MKKTLLCLAALAIGAMSLQAAHIAPTLQEARTLTKHAIQRIDSKSKPTRAERVVNTSRRNLQKVAADYVPQFYGSVVYSVESWTDPQMGIYSFTGAPGTQVEKTPIYTVNYDYPNFPAVYGGTAVGDQFIGMHLYWDDNGNTVSQMNVFDMNNWGAPPSIPFLSMRWHGMSLMMKPMA